MNYYVHDVPGRIRVKTASVKGNPGLAQKVEEFISVLDGVTTVQANPVTGSVLVHYRPEIVGADQVLDSLREQGHFDPAKATTWEQYAQEKVSKTFQFIVKALLGAAIEMAFEGTPLALLAAIL